MMAAIDPQEAMIAAMGEDRSTWHAPMGYFLPGSPCANDAGMDFRRKRWTTDEVKAMLDKAGYDGESRRAAASDGSAHLQRVSHWWRSMRSARSASRSTSR